MIDEMFVEMFKTSPETITDYKGRIWENTKDYLSGSFMWTTDKTTNYVFATPHFDTEVGVPYAVFDENDEYIFSDKSETESWDWKILTEHIKCILSDVD